MARRKRTVRARSFSRFTSRRAKRNYSSGENLTQTMIASAVYGGMREKVSNMLTPITSRIPLGTVADEVVLGAIHYFGAKKVKNPMLKSLFKAGLIVESARLGEAVVDGSMFRTSTATTNVQSWF